MRRFVFHILSCFIVALIALLFNSCQNESIDIVRPDVSISIILNNVLSPFQAYADEDMKYAEESGIKAKVKVVSFVYDDSGKLIDTYQTIVDNYNANQLNFKTSIAGANPTIVSFSYGTWSSSDGQVTDAYYISGQNLLSTLEIKANFDIDIYSIPWKVLGANISTIGSSSSANVVLHPLGGLVYTEWRNIHAHDSEAPAPKYYVLMYKNNDIAKISNGTFTFSTSLSSTYYNVSYINVSRFPSYKNIYGYQFFFPGSFDTMAYGSYDDANDEMQETQISEHLQIAVATEKQYVFALNCTDYTLHFSEGKLD